MARPTDWAVLDLDHDPTPGDPQHVKEISGRMRDIGDEAERASRDVRGLAGDDAIMGWIGASGDAFRNHIGKFPGQLDKVAASHHLCADALLEFGNSLDACQSQADRALVQARPLHDQVQRLQTQLASAHTDLASAGRGVTAAQAAATVDPTSVQTAIRSQTTAQSAVDSLNSQLSGPAAQLEALKKLAASAESLRHTAEDTAKAKIHTAADAGIPPDSMWHKLGHLAGELWHGLVIVAEVVSCIGALVLMVVGGPVWLVVAVVAAGVIVFTDTVNKYAHGKASLWQVGLSFLSCIPITKGLTSMAALGDAFRTGGLLGAGAHLAGAAGTAAKDTLTGLAGLLRLGRGRPVWAAMTGLNGDFKFIDLKDVKLPVRAFENRPGFSIFGSHDSLGLWMRNVKPDPGFFDVAVHGDPDWVTYFHRTRPEGYGPLKRIPIFMDPKEFAGVIRSNGWDGKSPIRLLSCETGAEEGASLKEGPFAQRLANELGVTVKAPNRMLAVWPDGKILVAPPLSTKKPDLPDYKQVGDFITFHPKGK